MTNTKLLLISMSLFLGATLVPNSVKGETSLEYSKMGKVVLSAFKCSIFAEKAEKADEQKRLFVFAFEHGKEFIEALKDGEIKETDFNQEVTAYIQMLLGGPSADFMLGRIYEFSAERAYRELGNPQSGYSDKAVKTQASHQFSKKECERLGQ